VGRWAVASVGPLAETEKVAGKESRAQDIGRDVTEGEAAIIGQEQGLKNFDEDAVGGDGHEGKEGGLAMTTARVRRPADQTCQQPEQTEMDELVGLWKVQKPNLRQLRPRHQAKARDEGGERCGDAPAKGVPGGVRKDCAENMTYGLQQEKQPNCPGDGVQWEKLGTGKESMWGCVGGKEKS